MTGAVHNSDCGKGRKRHRLRVSYQSTERKEWTEINPASIISGIIGTGIPSRRASNFEGCFRRPAAGHDPNFPNFPR